MRHPVAHAVSDLFFFTAVGLPWWPAVVYEVQVAYLMLVGFWMSLTVGIRPKDPIMVILSAHAVRLTVERFGRDRD